MDAKTVLYAFIIILALAVVGLWLFTNMLESCLRCLLRKLKRKHKLDERHL